MKNVKNGPNAIYSSSTFKINFLIKIRFTKAIIAIIIKNKDTLHLVIDGYNNKLFSSDSAIEFYERYKEYIPAAKLQNSRLWNEIVEQRKKQILSEITA